ncbi:DNA-processing protein DprA [Metabacillus litoralis]|uniref:DNA-processing protein DprA n=1 Tax=Metabacillus litoralis TaxID=152268 RepID=UPI000EF5FC5C|nr:DNA-processing protein DprA [Metabacillus litoralis]
MDDVTKKLFLLAHCKELNSQIIYKLLTIDPSLQIFFQLKDDEWLNYFNVKKHKIDRIKNEYFSYSADLLIRKYNQQNISFLPLFDPNYPYLLKQIADPPPFLFYKGNITLASRKNLISVVGTRYPSEYGVQALEHVLKPLILEKWVIVSGLAKGIDTLAHEAALNHGGETIAVIGGGLECIYPRQNQTLANKLMTSHLILSEHSPSTSPQKWHFPKRNRIISGISLGTLIIQAKQRSGSLITAHQALEQNREVFAIPGSIFDECSIGGNELIQNGAKLVQHASHIIEEFPQGLKMQI